MDLRRQYRLFGILDTVRTAVSKKNDYPQVAKVSAFRHDLYACDKT